MQVTSSHSHSGSLGKSCLVLTLCCLALVIAAPAQTLTTIANFGATTTSRPSSPLVEGNDGNFYGTTYANADYGSVFNVTPEGVLTVLHYFDYSDGSGAIGVILATDGNFYGTTQYGGTNDLGTVFKMTPDWTVTTLYNFSGPDGAHPGAGLVQAADGNLYGTTTAGGTNNSLGTVFKITLKGNLTTLFRFHGTDGKSPNAALVQDASGRLYGTTEFGGAHTFGTVFSITTRGRLTSLHSFDTSDGQYPTAALFGTADGAFYGTTYGGGNVSKSWCPSGCGTIFKITSAGAFSTLYKFCPNPSNTPCLDGDGPYGGLIQATDGNFYGTSSQGGSANLGVIFKLTPENVLTPLYDFCTKAFCPDGSLPATTMLQGPNGDLYGTTPAGGNSTYPGTVFSFALGLPPRH